MANTLGENFQQFCRGFNKSAWYLRLIAYVIGGATVHSIGIFAVLGVDLYGGYLNKPGSQE